VLELNELRDIPFLDHLTTDKLQKIANESVLLSLEKDDILFREGDTGRDLFIVLEGKVVVEVAKPGGEPEKTVEIHQSKPGEVFGELSYIDSAPRSATVRAAQPCRILQIPADGLDRLIRDDHSMGYRILRNLSRVLADRLRASDLRYRNVVNWV